MLENAKDLLYIVLSFCILWLTVFLCWLIYYMVSILRNANTMVEDLRDRFRGMEEALKSIRDKFEHASSNFTFVAEGIVKLIQYFVGRKRGGGLEEEIEEILEEKKKKKK